MGVIYATSDALLKAVLARGLGSGANYHDHCCQFCGFGPNDPCPDESDDSPHAEHCLWVQIVEQVEFINEQAAKA